MLAQPCHTPAWQQTNKSGQQSPSAECLLLAAVCLLQVKKAQDDKVLLAQVMRDNDERLRARAQAAAKEQEDDRRWVQSLCSVISQRGR